MAGRLSQGAVLSELLTMTIDDCAHNINTARRSYPAPSQWLAGRAGLVGAAALHRVAQTLDVPGHASKSVSE